MPNQQELKQIQHQTAIEGADEMRLAITASTLTTVVVFLPLVFINPEIRMLYSGVALTITYSLLASLLTALTLVPMLVARFNIKTAPQVEKDDIDIEPQQPKQKKLFVDTMRALYRKSISVSITFRYLLVLLALAGVLRVIQESKKLEREFIGIAEQNKFTIHIELPTGTKLEVSDKIVSQVEKIVGKVPEIKIATSKVEPWSSKIYVEMVPLNKRSKSTAQIIQQLRPLTEKFEPAFIYYEEPEEVGTKEILIEIYGYDYDVLKDTAVQIAQRMQSIPKFTDTKIRMREGRPEMRLIIDKRQAALYGLNVEGIALTLHASLRGLVGTRYRGKDEPLIRTKDESFTQSELPPFSLEEKQILQQKNKEAKTLHPSAVQKETKETESIVRLQERFRRTFEDLRRIALITPDGEQVYLSQVANFKFDLGPSEIWRKNKSRMVQVSANTGGMALGTAADKVKEVLANLKFPKDYFWQFGGNYDKMIRNQKELSFALIISLVLVYMILSGLFESFSQPFIILMSVPLASIGAIIALRITHKPIGTGVLIGAIMLEGIVVNNAIVLIDRINFLRKKLGSAYSVREIVVAASLDRVRPIMMTKLTTILGLIPMALDKSESSNLFAPLAITTIGGLSLASFMTLFIIPCIYMIFRDLGLTKK